jgi:hypothetical protein
VATSSPVRSVVMAEAIGARRCGPVQPPPAGVTRVRRVQYPPKLPAAPGNTTGLSVPSFATAATPK